MASPSSVSITLTLDNRSIEALAREVELRLSHRSDKPSSPWLNTEEAAKYLRCPTSRVLKLVHTGDLPRSKDGRRNLYSREDLERFIETGGASSS